ncbi:hypothetical protein GRI42_02240 [Erythrobacter gaetbuli]|uniref:Uncharacterized protein n=1 Tax=Qipengyuania gaetbuli TaxID=266952 RepID=A0A844XYZ3_9SPHN|nr:hypothetical protein [Qipengyuania gaetbuli]MXO50122.1 hypothetical protein [Qipengyuania gaetbuli]
MSKDNCEKAHYGRGTAAGSKGNTPTAKANSVAAASQVTQTLPRRHRQVVEAFASYGAFGARPEDVANDLELPVHVVRPRCGELRKRGLLHEVGKRPGLWGCDVTAFSVVKPDDEAA